MTWRLGLFRVDDRPIASGATAEVFVARRGRTGPRVAIKVLPLRTYRERAETEAQTATIDHPRLVSIHQTVIDERRGVVGLVMDLAADGDLRTALRSGSAPTPVEMLQVADDVLAALEALHAQGIVHRDIKPENILLERVDGQLRARLGDLGIARPVDRTRSTGSVLGTDLYIAPEVHDGGAPSKAADLWALGYVLYEGLFGAPPHADAATTYQAIGRLRADGPDRPPNVPDSIWRVVAMLLAPNPSDRPESASEARALVATGKPLAVAASALAPQTVVLARPVPRRRSAAKGGMARRPMYERSPGVVRTAAIGTALVLLVGGLAFLGGKEPLGWFGGSGTPRGAMSSVTPLSPVSRELVPTQYQWRLRDGVLTGRLSVTNPSNTTTAASEMPELFPASAASDGALALVGFNGKSQKQSDGSVLVRFAVPPLAPQAHHIVAFRMTVPDAKGDRAGLAHLVRDREIAINKLAFTLSDAPTLERVSVVALPPSLDVGDDARLVATGVMSDGTTAPAALLTEARYQLVSGAEVVRLDGATLRAVGPGRAVVRVVVGDLTSESTVFVTAPPTTLPTPTTVKKKVTPRAPVTTSTTTAPEEIRVDPEETVI